MLSPQHPVNNGPRIPRPTTAQAKAGHQGVVPEAWMEQARALGHAQGEAGGYRRGRRAGYRVGLLLGTAFGALVVALAVNAGCWAGGGC